jgi:transposase-like protein
MVAVNLKCPFCGSENVGKFGFFNGKQRYICKNAECGHKTFLIDYTYNAYKPNIEQEIIKLTVEGMGIRSISRKLKISADTVISILKKKKYP